MIQRYAKQVCAALAVGAAALAMPAGAQMWFDVSGLMSPVVNDQCTGGRCGDSEQEDAPPLQVQWGEAASLALTAGPAASPAVSRAELTFEPSADRRRANLARFVDRMRQTDPAGASEMEALFASEDIIGQIGSGLAAYGFSVDNLADAYAAWWVTAWEGANGSNRDFSRAEMQAVQAQAQNALLATATLGEMTDAQKQEMAEALQVQAAMIESLVDLAKQDDALMPQLRSSIRQGARASGVDLDAMVLTEEGFRPR